jgi:hypothetical protein
LEIALSKPSEGNLPGSLVLVYYQDRPSVYARIDAIEPDVKKGWYQVTLLLLMVPAQNVTWILREEYIRGEPFTMGGQPVKLEPVPPYRPPERPSSGPEQDESGRKEQGLGKPGKVVPFKKGPA